MSDASVVGAQSEGDIGSYRYSAPELHRTKGDGMNEIRPTKESDVYGMGMVVYEVSSFPLVSSGRGAQSHTGLLGLGRG